MSKVTCIYHGVDTDGRVSALIVRKYYESKGQTVQFISCNYSGEDIKIDAEPGSTVVIVDYSMPLDVMQAIDEQFKLIWIDHHPVIDQHGEQGFNPAGIRSKEHSAAWYTWEYFFPDVEMPLHVKLTSDYDTWQHKDPRSMAFNASSFLYGLSQVWSYDYRQLEDESYLNQMIEDGFKILKTTEVRNGCVSEFIFETAVHGIPAIAINMRGTNSTVFNAYKGDYDYKVMITFGLAGENMDKAIVTLYSRQDSGVDVGKIAESFGGGGHAGASGFQCAWSELPFLTQPTSTDAPPLGSYMEPLMLHVASHPKDGVVMEAYMNEHKRTLKSFGRVISDDVVLINSPWWYPIDNTKCIAWCYHRGRHLYRIFNINANSINELFCEPIRAIKMNDRESWVYSSKKYF
jgi:oligoribonuclease NrnB/cAMP/cGMP phosphodiesterase (DHH superfamily)